MRWPSPHAWRMTRGFRSVFPQSAAHLDWQPRRANPAAAYLMDREVVRHLSFLGMGQWVVGVIERTDATRRFVKSQT